MSRIRRFIVAGALLVAPTLLGCGSGGKAVVPVQGQVLYKGKPTPQAVVIFHPEDGGDPQAPRPLGHVDEQGKFTLTSYTAGDGAPEGNYRVSVSWDLASRVGPGDDTVTRNYLPPRYANPQTSGLRVTVARGVTQLDPFLLTP